MEQAQRLLWTHEVLNGWLRKREYENLPMDATPDKEDTDESSAALEIGDAAEPVEQFCTI